MTTRREERLERLRERLRDGRALHLKEAAERLGVSPMTVRRDLSAASAEFSYLGGYVMAPRAERTNGYRFEFEKDVHAEAKARACLHAASTIQAGDTIFVDCGTTMPHLVEALTDDMPLTVVCYALNIAQLLSGRPKVRMLLLGGEFSASSASFFSEEALRTLERIGINKAFLSAGGVHKVHGVSCSNFHEVPIKQAAMRRAVKSYLVIDASKTDVVKPAPFAELGDFAAVFTEEGVANAARGWR